MFQTLRPSGDDGNRDSRPFGIHAYLTLIARLDDLSDHVRHLKLASHLFGAVGYYLLSMLQPLKTANRPRTDDE